MTFDIVNLVHREKNVFFCLVHFVLGTLGRRRGSDRAGDRSSRESIFIFHLATRLRYSKTIQAQLSKALRNLPPTPSALWYAFPAVTFFQSYTPPGEEGRERTNSENDDDAILMVYGLHPTNKPSPA